MASFTITSKHGQFEVLVDDEDYERVMKHSWHVSFRSSQDKSYLQVRTNINGKKVRLHRFIMNIEKSKLEVDHLNFNTLDNRKNNLKVCTPRQNNCRKRHKNIQGYVGIEKTKGNRYSARATVNGFRKHIGIFNTAEEAARAYDKYVYEKCGNDAYLNFTEKKGES